MFDGITALIDVSLSKPGEMRDRCCSPRGCKEADMTEQLFTLVHRFIKLAVKTG